MNPDGTTYDSVLRYNESNPKGYKIKNIVIEKGVTYIGNWAFYRVCVNTLTIPEGVKTIGAWAIRFSPSLKTVNLPNSLTTLGDFSLSKNKTLKTVKFGNNLKTIGNGVFSSSAVEELILPDSVTSIGEDLNKDYNGINEKNIGVFDNCFALKKVSLGSVDKIPQRAFINCKNLSSIVIPNAATSIGIYAFADCTSLKTVTFEKNSICSLFSNYAFYNCSALTSITGATALKTVNDVALKGCNNLQCFEFSNANTTFYNYCFSSKPLTGTVRIGDGLVTVQAGLLTKTKIDTLYISNKVQKIQSQAIANCTLLENIYYEGTRQQWDAIAKTSDWAKGVSATCTVHFSDGTTALLSKVD